MKSDNKNSRVDRGWNSMEVLLDERMPQKKDKRRVLIIFFLFGLLLAIVFNNIMTSEMSPMAEHQASDIIKSNDNKDSQNAALTNKALEQNARALNSNNTEATEKENTVSQKQNNNPDISSNEEEKSINTKTSNTSKNILNSNNQKQVLAINNQEKQESAMIESRLSENALVENKSSDESDQMDSQSSEALSDVSQTGFDATPSFENKQLEVKSIPSLGLTQLNIPTVIPNMHLTAEGFINPVQESLKRTNIYAGIFYERFTQQNLNSLGLSLGIDQDISSQLYLGLDLSYHWVRLPNSADELSLVEDAQEPELEDGFDNNVGGGSEELIAGEAIRSEDVNSYLNRTNTRFNHFSSMFKLGWHVFKDFDFEIFYSFDFYNTLENLTGVNNPSADPNGLLNQNQFFVSTRERFNTSSTGLALKYKAGKNINLTGRYRYGLSEISVLDNIQFNPSSIQFGAEYIF